MFNAIRSALLSSYGDIGAMKVILMDFERAAMNAVNDVFPEVCVKGCSFHFRQALMRRVQQEGLKSVYEKDSRYPSARTWLRMVMAMSMLPAFAAPLVWNELKNAFTTGDTVLDAKLQAFAQYFDGTWVNGDFSPQLWTHFDHTGPRTTNLAEGFHNSLNSRFGMPHPSLRTFLDWLQKCQYETQCRIIQLTAGRPAKQKSAVYERLDADIQSAKLTYGLQIGTVFASVFPGSSAWPLFHQHSGDYLRRMSYLIGA